MNLSTHPFALRYRRAALGFDTSARTASMVHMLNFIADQVN